MMNATTFSPHSTLHVLVACPLGDAHAACSAIRHNVLPGLREQCRRHGMELEEMEVHFAHTTSEHGTAAAWANTQMNRRPFVIVLVQPEEDGRTERSAARHGLPTSQIPEHLYRSMGTALVDAALDHPAVTGRGLLYFLHSSPGTVHVHNESAVTSLADRARRNGFVVRDLNHDTHVIAETVQADLATLFAAALPLEWQHDLLRAERAAHAAFAATRIQAYVEIPEYLEWLDTQTGANGARCVVVSGPPGSGKSSLLAQWAARTRGNDGTVHCIEHYIGNGTSGDHHAAIVRRIIEEVREHHGIQDPVPINGQDDALPSWLARTRAGSTVIVMDALNQLEQASQGLAWLPEYMPPGIVLVVSTTEGPALERLRERGWPELAVRPLDAVKRRAMIRGYLREHGIALDIGHRARLAGDAANGNPLLLRARIDALHPALGNGALDTYINRLFGADSVDEILQQVIERLEQEHGRPAVCDMLGLLWASRTGLSRTELIDMAGVPADTTAALLAALEHYLISRNGLLVFFHDEMRRAVERRYMPRRNGSAAHTVRGRIAGYFRTNGTLARRAVEEPWQHMQMENWQGLHEAVAEIPMMMEMKRRGTYHDLVRYWGALGDRFDMRETCIRSIALHRAEGGDTQTEAELWEIAGDLAGCTGHYDAAREFLHHALELHGGGHANCTQSARKRAGAHAHLAELYYSTHDIEAAMEMSRRALELLELAGDSSALAHGHADLGAILLAAGLHEEAALHLTRAVTMCGHSPAMRPILATALNTLGALRITTEEFAAAARYFESARDMNRELLGPEHPEVALNTVNIAFAMQGQGDHQTANTLFRAALGIAERALGPRHPQLAIILTNLGSLHRDLGNLESAEQFFSRALTIRRRALGREHGTTLSSMHRLAYVLKAQGHYTAARELYEEAIGLHERTYGTTTPALESWRRGLAELSLHCT